jgi:regulator of sigma E protease
MQIFNYALNITSLISINLGVFNLIPFPALDGGRLLFLLIEAISKKRIPAEIEAKINFGGMVLLMGLMLFVVFKDIISLV